jgi:alpha-tubulin suppressor-like RCC1 family protein
MVAGGGYFANCVLLASGDVDCFGSNRDGNLDLGSVSSIWSAPYDTPQSAQIKGVRALFGTGVSTDAPSCAVLATGAVQCWGEADYPSLGDGKTSKSGTAVSVSGISTAIYGATGGQNICILLSDGALQCFGKNEWGEVGDGTVTWSGTPVATTLTSGVAGVSVGWDHTCAVTTAGAVKCVGFDREGELGDGTGGNYGTSNATTTWQTPISSGAIAVACGNAHTCALMKSGKVYCWGDNTYGQLGDESIVPNSPTPVLVKGF